MHFFLYVYEIRNKRIRLHSQSPSTLTISPHFGQVEVTAEGLRKVGLYIRPPMYPSFLFIIFTQNWHLLYILFWNKLFYIIYVEKISCKLKYLPTGSFSFRYNNLLFVHNTRTKCTENICRIIWPHLNVNNIVNFSGRVGKGLHHDF